MFKNAKSLIKYGLLGSVGYFGYLYYTQPHEFVKNKSNNHLNNQQAKDVPNRNQGYDENRNRKDPAWDATKTGKDVKNMHLSEINPNTGLSERKGERQSENKKDDIGYHSVSANRGEENKKVNETNVKRF